MQSAKSFAHSKAALQKESQVTSLRVRKQLRRPDPRKMPSLLSRARQALCRADRPGPGGSKTGLRQDVHPGAFGAAAPDKIRRTGDLGKRLPDLPRNVGEIFGRAFLFDHSTPKRGLHAREI